MNRITKNAHMTPKYMLKYFINKYKQLYVSINKENKWWRIEYRNPKSLTILDLYNEFQNWIRNDRIEKEFSELENKGAIIVKKLLSELNENIQSKKEFPQDFETYILEYINLLYVKIWIYKILNNYWLALDLTTTKKSEERNDILKKAYSKIAFPRPDYITSKNLIISFIQARKGNEYIITDSPLVIHPNNKDINNIKNWEELEIHSPLSSERLISISYKNSYNNIFPRISSVPRKYINDPNYIYARTVQINTILALNACWFIAWSNKNMVKEYSKQKESKKLYQYNKKVSYSETEILKTAYFLEMINK